nr:YkvA family protein [Marinicella sp. W31]MDC2879936.1 YkvA family protein [Marinicella sp. W31]
MSDIKFGDILEPGDEDTKAENERTVRKGFWGKVRKTAAHIPFARDAVAAYYCATDRDTPLGARVILYSALAYFIMPVDLIPDVLMFVGFSDDLAVLTTALTMIRRNMTIEHYHRADTALGALEAR